MLAVSAWLYMPNGTTGVGNMAVAFAIINLSTANGGACRNGQWRKRFCPIGPFCQRVNSYLLKMIFGMSVDDLRQD